jgi:hypothetical protein
MNGTGCWWFISIHMQGWNLQTPVHAAAVWRDAQGYLYLTVSWIWALRAPNIHTHVSTNGPEFVMDTTEEWRALIGFSRSADGEFLFRIRQYHTQFQPETLNGWDVLRDQCLDGHTVCTYKVKLSLCLITYAPRHEDAWVSGDIAPSFLTSALDGGEWSASRPCRFTSNERAPGNYWIWGWVGPRVGLDAVEKRKISFPCQKATPGCQARSPSLYRLGYPGSCPDGG